METFAEFLRQRLQGDYTVDEFGFDKELTERVLLPITSWLYTSYWRVTPSGIENIPATGSALLVANHAGTLPWDGVMLQTCVHREHPSNRHLRLLAADLAMASPYISHLARKSGSVLAAEDDSLRLLRAGELVGVFPEGFKGVGKSLSQRYRLQRFGRGGFAGLALKTRTPIIPVAIVGSEEIYPMVANLKGIAKFFRLPYFPVTPFFPALGPAGLIPLPSKWSIEFGEPILMDSYDEDAFEDSMAVFELTDLTKDTIQQMLDKAVASRKSIF